MDLRMSEDERQAFLAGVHIGVISIEREDGPPLTVPIWYGYEPGGNVWITTGTDSLKNKLLHKAQRFSISVQTEEAPFDLDALAERLDDQKDRFRSVSRHVRGMSDQSQAAAEPSLSADLG